MIRFCKETFEDSQNSSFIAAILSVGRLSNFEQVVCPKMRLQLKKNYLFQYLQNEWEIETGLKFNSDNNNRLFMVPHLIRAHIGIHLFHQLTHTE